MMMFTSEDIPISAMSKQQSMKPLIFYFIFSAQSETSLIDYLVSMKAYLNEYQVDLQQLSYNLSVYRTAFDYRVGFVCSSCHELISAIDLFLHNPVMDKITDTEQKIAFVFSGQGNEWDGVGQDLYEAEPIFRAVVHQCQSIMTTISEESVVVDFFNGNKNICAATDNASKQVFIFVLQIGLATRWFSLGLNPYAVCGHSMGEVAAACFSGMIDLEHALRLIYHRGKAVDLSEKDGGMLVVNLAPDRILPIIENYEKVWIAVENSPSWCVLSGDLDRLQEISYTLSQQKVSFKFMDNTIAFHSPYMKKGADYLISRVNSAHYQPVHTRLFSTVTGDELTHDSIAVDHWGNNLIGPVRFATCISQLLDAGIQVFIEIGPHTVLSSSVRETASSKNQPMSIVSTLVKNGNDKKSFYHALVHLFRLGIAVQWSQLFATRENKMSLPQYCWDRHHVMDLPPPLLCNNQLAGVVTEDDELLFIIHGVWQEILSIDNIGLDVDLSEYNINSLNIIQFISRVRSFLGIELNISQLAGHRTIRSVTEYISNVMLETV